MSTKWLNFMVELNNTSTESEILEAAKRIFQRKGLFGARMQEIADEAKINKSMLHYYYRSKQLLFEAVFMQAFTLMAPQLNKIINADTNLEEKIRGFSFNYISFIIKHPYLPNFIIQELNSNPAFLQKLVSEKNFPNIEVFKTQVLQNIQEGKIRAIDPNQLFINIMALNVFPFIGKPLLQGFTKLDDKAYKIMMEARKNEVANFIINAIKVES